MSRYVDVDVTTSAELQSPPAASAVHAFADLAARIYSAGDTPRNTHTAAADSPILQLPSRRFAGLASVMVREDLFDAAVQARFRQMTAMLEEFKALLVNYTFTPKEVLAPLIDRADVPINNYERSQEQLCSKSGSLAGSQENSI